MVSTFGKLAAVGMYRRLDAAVPRLAALLQAPEARAKGRALRVSWLFAGDEAAARGKSLPRAEAALDAHLLFPAECAERAAALPVVTATSPESASVERFYAESLYPAWRWPESFGYTPAAIGERMRRQFPGFRWQHDIAPRHRVLVVGAGSGHHVAQLLMTHTGCDVVALDLSAPSLAYADARLERCLPHECRRRHNSLVADITNLADPPSHAAGAALLGTRFHLACCVGVLHHVPDPARTLRDLVKAYVLPGGLLQLATYSTLSVERWRPAARTLLHAMLPAVVGAGGELLRQPTDAELRGVRQRILARARAGVCDTAARLVRFGEFFSAAGVRDLLFHPQETSFTLLELREMLAAAKLTPVGVFFAALDADARARRAYRDAGGTDAAQADLAVWHRVECKDKEVFGRMHHVYAVYEA